MSTMFTANSACENAFARGLGFENYDDLMDASHPVFSPVGEVWYMAELPSGCWLAWPYPDFDDTHRFDTYEEAHEFVVPSVC